MFHLFFYGNSYKEYLHTFWYLVNKNNIFNDKITIASVNIETKNKKWTINLRFVFQETISGVLKASAASLRVSKGKSSKLIC